MKKDLVYGSRSNTLVIKITKKSKKIVKNLLAGIFQVESKADGGNDDGGNDDGGNDDGGNDDGGNGW